MIERQLDGAHRAFVSAQIVQALFEMARLLSGQFAGVQPFDRIVHLFGEKLALMKDDELGAGRASRLNEEAVIRILIAIPINRRRGFERPGVAVKHGQSRLFEIEFNFGLENIQVRFHPVRLHQVRFHQ